MEIFVIKQYIPNYKVLQEYFFTFSDQLTYEKKLNYFITNGIAESKYKANYYYSLPFKIITILISSLNNKSDSLHLTNHLYIPNQIWTNEYFNDSIPYISQKKNLLIHMVKSVHLFIKKYYEEKIISKDNMNTLCSIFNNESIMNFLRAKNNNIMSVFDDMINFNDDSDNPFDFNEEYSTNKSYLDVLIIFLQNSVQLFNTFDTCDITKYDYFETKYETEDMKYLEYMKINITKIYSNFILRFIFDDLIDVIQVYLRK